MLSRLGEWSNLGESAVRLYKVILMQFHAFQISLGEK